jgi:hypothetical protein
VRSIVKPAALVQNWLETLRPEQRDTALALNDATLAAEPTLLRTIKWGNLMFLHQGVHAVSVVMHKDHANLQVFNGALLAPAFPALEGTGKGLRHLKFRYSQAVDTGLVTTVVRASVEQLGSIGS